MKSNKILLTCFIVLALLSFVYIKMIMITIIFIIVVGLWQHIKERPIRKMRNEFDRIFDEIGLHVNGQTPYYYSNEDRNEFIREFAFYSLLPLNEWNKKKGRLEIYLNATIIDIEQNTKDYRYISLLVEKQPLFKSIKWNDSYLILNEDVLNIGKSYFGIVGMDLQKYPHAFIAGETGSGKSNILKCLIYQSLKKEYEVTLIDFKRGVVFSQFQEVVPIYFEYKETLKVLKNIINEIKYRLDLLREHGVESLNDYNKYAKTMLKRKIIFIDELAELLSVRDKELSNLLYDCIETITRISRAVGIHLIMGIQRPDSKIINGQIKSNVSYRLCGHFVDKEPSRIMLGNDSASLIMNIKGRFIAKEDKLTEVQCFYFDNPMYKPHRNDFEDMTTNIHENRKQSSDDTEIPLDSEKKKLTTLNSVDFDFCDVSKK